MLEDLHRKAYSEEGTGVSFGKLIDDVFNLVRLRGNYWALDGVQMILAQELGIISQIPNVSTSDVEDKSNGDFLVKFLAIAQATWQIIQIIVRSAKGYPTSQAEIVTVGFAICALCTYVFWWKKPQDAEAPYLVQAKRLPTRDDMYRLADIGPSYLGSMYGGPLYKIPEHAIHMDGTKETASMQGGIPMWAGALACGTIFGLLHCTAWNFHFPTEIERTLWRAASVLTSSLPLLLTFRGVLAKTCGGVFDRNGVLGRGFDIIATLLYTGSRLYLLVETVRSAFFLEPRAFLMSV